MLICTSYFESENINMTEFYNRLLAENVIFDLVSDTRNLKCQFIIPCDDSACMLLVESV